jgi:hypothetical protein
MARLRNSDSCNAISQALAWMQCECAARFAPDMGTNAQVSRNELIGKTSCSPVFEQGALQYLSIKFHG